MILNFDPKIILHSKITPVKILSIIAVVGLVICSASDISKEAGKITNKDHLEIKIFKDPRTSFKDQKLEISYCRVSKKCCKIRDDKCEVQMGGESVQSKDVLVIHIYKIPGPINKKVLKTLLKSPQIPFVTVTFYVIEMPQIAVLTT